MQKVVFIIGVLLAVLLPAQEVIWQEAESLENTGTWANDPQHVDIMGSPYLLATGLGEPVKDAYGTVKVSQAGTYTLCVRCRDWYPSHSPGQFAVSVDGKSSDISFGKAKNDEWQWINGGSFSLNKGEIELRIKDLTGWWGRVDALVLSAGNFKPSNDLEKLNEQRIKYNGVSTELKDMGKYDVVVVSGGSAGLGAAIAAARNGIKVAFIQDRPILGGNCSDEIMVPPMGYQENPVDDVNVTGIAEEIYPPQSYNRKGSSKVYEAIVRAEKNIDLFLGHHAFGVNKNDRKIESVDVMNVRTNEVFRFKGKFFSDSTGHGVILELAGAEGTLKDKGRMGMSNMWRWKTTEREVKFPETPWALELGEGEFPYPKKNHAQWFWESGYDKHPYNDLELIRDWNLRANFGAWNAIKNKEAYYRYDKSGAKHAKADLMWMAYVGGTRETKQDYGDILVEEKDVVSGKKYPDSCVLATWSIDLHYPKKQYIGKFKDNPFISYAVHGKGVDRKKGYAFPYRSFYSKNFDNLYIACRALSVTHEALGTIRVMNTLGMVGVAVGRACHVAVKHNTTTRGVYEKHLEEAKELWRLPGSARKELK